jgi:general nucleoside transport system permease protein
MIRLEARAQVSPLRAFAVAVIAAIVTLVLAAIIFALAGIPVLHGYGLMIAAACGSLPALGRTLSHAGVLTLTGLAAAIAFRIKLWNLGAAGQAQAGAVAALAVGTGLANLPPLLVIPLVLVAGMLAGALLMVVPVVLRVRRGSNEAIVTLLFNVMMMMLMPTLLAASQAHVLPAAALLPKLGWLIGAHAGVLIALAAVLVIWLALPFTLWGFMVRATAGNAAAARFAGIKVDRVFILVGLISGALAGFAGAVVLAGQAGPLTPAFGIGVGYAGIAVAVLAGRSLPGLLLAALFVAALQIGAAALPQVGAEIGEVLVALVLILALAGHTLARFRVRERPLVQAAP